MLNLQVMRCSRNQAVSHIHGYQVYAFFVDIPVNRYSRRMYFASEEKETRELWIRVCSSGSAAPRQGASPAPASPPTAGRRSHLMRLHSGRTSLKSTGFPTSPHGSESDTLGAP